MAVLVSVAAAPWTSAQEARGSIAGTVSDVSGGAVPGATVIARNVATNVPVSAVTDRIGNYALLYLPAGRYEVTAEVSGFRKVARAVEVRVGDRLSLNLQVEPGNIAEQVEVVAGTPLLDTATGSAGQVIDAKRISLLPLSDGNPFVLSRLAPGASYTGDLKFSRPFDNAGTSAITVDGASGGNEFTLDGTPNMATGRRAAYVPPSDAVEEFKVETATYDAQQGHTAGANVNVVMKSGTNRFHGSLYEFYRSDKISANDFFLNKAGKPRAPLSYNRFGGSLGGPVTLPGYDGRDRTFFMLAYEGLYDEFPEPGQYTVPTEAERRGDFSALLSQGIVIYNPYSAQRRSDGRVVREPFLNNVIPQKLLDPIALNYLNYYPLPNQPGDAQGRNNYIGPNGRGDRFANVSLRVDHRLSASHRFFVRVSWNDRREDRNNWTGEVNGIRPTGNYLFRRNYNAIYDHVYTRSSSSVFNLRVGFSRFEEPNVRQSEGVFDPKTLGFPATTAAYFEDASIFPRFEIGGMSVLGDTTGGGRFQNIFSVQPTYTKLVGNHAFRMGYDGRMYTDNSDPAVNPAGRYDFGTDYTKGPLDNSPGAAIGQQLAAFLLGQPTGGLIDRSSPRNNRNLYHAVFVQDDWRVTARLTLNLGLRYDYETAGTEAENRNIRGFDPTIVSPIAQPAEAAYAAKPMPEVSASDFKVRGGLTFLDSAHRAMWQPARDNIQPRAGFSFRVTDKTVMRGGFGMYSVPLLLETFNQAGYSQSTSIVPSLDTGLTFRANLANPFPDGVADPPGSSLGAATFLGRSLDPTIPPGVRNNDRHMRWSIGFERELPGQWVFEAAYVGDRGYDLPVQWADNTSLRNLELNPVPRQYLSTSPIRDDANNNYLTTQVPNPFAGLLPGTSYNGKTISRQQLLRPYPEFDNVRSERRDGTSMYDAAQLRLEKRFTAGFSLLVGYTYSRFTEKRILLNATDTVPTEYLAADDMPHRLLASGIWELPFGSKRRWSLGSVGNAILGGWNVQGIFNWQSGRPVAFRNSYYNGDPSKLKADYSDPSHVFDTSGFYFSDAAVQVNGVPDPAKQRADTRIRLSNNVRTFPFRPGVRGPGYYFLDASLIKTVPLARDVQLQLRIEAINALNHPIFDTPSTDPTSSDFGTTTSQYNIPRNLQFAVKVLF